MWVCVRASLRGVLEARDGRRPRRRQAPGEGRSPGQRPRRLGPPLRTAPAADEVGVRLGGSPPQAGFVQRRIDVGEGHRRRARTRRWGTCARRIRPGPPAACPWRGAPRSDSSLRREQWPTDSRAGHRRPVRAARARPIRRRRAARSPAARAASRSSGPRPCPSSRATAARPIARPSSGAPPRWRRPAPGHAP